MNATLNQVQLTSLDPAIVLLDVEELPPEMAVSTLPRGQGDGAVVTKSQRTALRVRLKMEIHQPDMARRKAACAKVAAWAGGGGSLTVSDRPGQCLDVRCEELPVLTSALNWTQPVTVTLCARDFPYWRASRAATANSAASATHAITLHPAGSAAEVTLEVQIRNASAQTVNALTVTTPCSTFALEALALAPGELLEIREEAGAVVIAAGGLSKLWCRAPQSSDRLLVKSGAENAISVTADAAVEVSVSARGAHF